MIQYPLYTEFCSVNHNLCPLYPVGMQQGFKTSQVTGVLHPQRKRMVPSSLYLHVASQLRESLLMRHFVSGNAQDMPKFIFRTSGATYVNSHYRGSSRHSADSNDFPACAKFRGKLRTAHMKCRGMLTRQALTGRIVCSWPDVRCGNVDSVTVHQTFGILLSCWAVYKKCDSIPIQLPVLCCG